MTETRRTALKMLGAISATCAFPFAGDELYGQHAHVLAGASTLTQPYTPTFFTPAEYSTIGRLVDLIIPPGDTPGALEAGVPAYIDLVVTANAAHQALVRAGLARLDRDARAAGAEGFLAMNDEAAIALLQPASDAVDREDEATRRSRFRADDSGRLVYVMPTTDRDMARTLAPPTVPDATADIDAPTLPSRFFRLVKNLTADGYYTSRIGLLDELGYTGNTAMLSFPSCVPEG